MKRAIVDLLAGAISAVAVSVGAALISSALAQSGWEPFGAKSAPLVGLIILCPVGGTLGIALAERLGRTSGPNPIAAGSAFFAGLIGAFLVLVLLDRLGTSLIYAAPVVVTVASLAGYRIASVALERRSNAS